MAYCPTTWKDEIVTNPTKYKITKENGTEEVVNIERVPGEIIQEGTRVTADKLNNIDQGIISNANEVGRAGLKMDELVNDFTVPALAYAYVNFKNQLSAQEIFDIEANESLMNIIMDSEAAKNISNYKEIWETLLETNLRIESSMLNMGSMVIDTFKKDTANSFTTSDAWSYHGGSNPYFGLNYSNPTLSRTFYESSRDYSFGYDINNMTQCAFVFVLDKDSKFNKVTIGMRTHSDTNRGGLVQVFIKNVTDSELPGNTIYSQVSVDFNSIKPNGATGSTVYQDFVFSIPLSLNPGKYSLVIRYPNGNNSNYVSILKKEGRLYNRKTYISVDSGNSWSLLNLTPYIYFTSDVRYEEIPVQFSSIYLDNTKSKVLLKPILTAMYDYDNDVKIKYYVSLNNSHDFTEIIPNNITVIPNEGKELVLKVVSQLRNPSSRNPSVRFNGYGLLLE